MTANGNGVQVLLDYVHAQGLQVGDRIPSIRKLSTALRMNASAVRDVVHRAQTMGIVRVVPSSGTVLQSVNYAPMVDAFSQTLKSALAVEGHHLIGIFEARCLIEIELAGIAAIRRRLADTDRLRQTLEGLDEVEHFESYREANAAFHLCVAEIAGNEVLHTMLRALLALLRPIYVGLPTRRQLTDERREHTAIYRSILHGNAKEARKAMSRHLEASNRFHVYGKRANGQASKKHGKYK